MKARPSLRLAALVLAGLIFLVATTAVAAANTVPASLLDDSSRAVTANDLKPSECDGIFLANLVVGSGTINGTDANDLILGSSSADTLNGGKGNDCLMGGGGNDALDGGQNDDVLIGGPGDDDLDGRSDYDSCYAAGGTDTFKRCEEEYP